MAADDFEIEFNDAAIRDFKYLAKNVGNLPEIISAAREIGPQPGIQALAKLIAERVSATDARVTRLVTLILRLESAVRHFGLPSPDFFNGITGSFQARATTSEGEEDVQRWTDAQPLLASIIDEIATDKDHPILASQKAGRIVHAHQNLLKDAMIITDLRPVFNDAGDEIVQSIITHVLSVDYFDGVDMRTIQFAMDAMDLVSLARKCARAERKANRTQEDLGSAEWKTYIFREPPSHHPSAD